MIQNRVLGLLGISAKARKVDSGTDLVIELIEKNKAKLVIVAEDAADRTKENLIYKAKQNNVPIEIYGKIDDISKAIGKSNKAVICIKDKHLSEEIYKIMHGGEAIG